MNSTKGRTVVPTAEPIVELISLARLSPHIACQRLRALLLVKPDYFRDVQSNSIKALLSIQEDTTYEILTGSSYDPLSQQLRAVISIKQPSGYSDNVMNNGSEEFVRFYLSYDGGLRWLDQGMRVVNVFDAPASNPRRFEVKLPIIPLDKLPSPEVLPRVRAILSWNTPPPARAPEWKPLWGNVVESCVRMQDSRVIFSGRLQSLAYVELRGTPLQTAVSHKRPLKGKSEVAMQPDTHRLPKAGAGSRHLTNMLTTGAGIALVGFRAFKSLLRGEPVKPNTS
ncbi:MAG TPA: hypothetical protein VGJ30_19780 [Candidatus Angelobacter sp.]